MKQVSQKDWSRETHNSDGGILNDDFSRAYNGLRTFANAHRLLFGYGEPSRFVGSHCVVKEDLSVEEAW